MHLKHNMGDDKNDEARKVEFARKVFQRVAQIEKQEYDRRCARFAEFYSYMLPHDKETYDAINAARADGRFSRSSSTSHLTYVGDGNGPAFRLCLDGLMFGEAVRFFEYWKRSNPNTTPSDESQLKCLADAEGIVPQGLGHVRDEFVGKVMENFELWKLGQ